MADRTVTYNFRGNFTNLAAGLTAAGRGVTDLGVKMTALDKNGVKMRAGLTAVGSAAGKLGLVAAAGFAVAVGAAANFEQAMSNVQAATHETSGNMELLRKAALEAGQATQYSATEAAGAIEELAKAGVSTKDILAGGLSGALDLAAAGGLEVADAAQIAATAMTQFKLAGDQVPHVADLLAAGAGKAQGDVSDLSMALKQSGLVAAQMGVSIEETTGTLAAFASAGLLGSDAGTSFRTMLLRLANPTEESAALMEQLGIQAYNAQGQFVGIEALAGQLAVAFDGQTQAQRDAALATLFGSDAIRAANVLYNQGAQGISDWTNKVNDQGYAAETAAIKMDNLKGDLEQLRGALETAFIGAGSGEQGPLRQLVQGATDAVNVFNKLPGPVQNTATALAGITAVTGGALWFGSKVVSGIADTRDALDKLGISSERASRGLRGVAAAGAGLGAIVITADLLQKAMDKIANTRIDSANLNRDLEALADGRLTDNLKNLASAFEDIGDKWQRDANPLSWISSWDPSGFEAASDTIHSLDEALAQMVESGNADQAAAAFDRILGEAAKVGVSADDAASHFTEYKTALENAAGPAQSFSGFLSSLGSGLASNASAAEKGQKATSDFGVAARQAAQASQQEASALADATKAMRDKTSATLAAFDAETGYRQALKDAKAQADKSNAGIKGSTDEVLANRSALSGLAAAWNNQSAAVKNNVDRYKDARRSFIQTAEAMGVPTAAAKQLADRILEIPKSKVSHVGVEGADTAIDKVQTLNRELSRVVSKTITVTVNRVGNALGGMQFASGGFTGPGGVNEPAGIVHRGEVVIPQRYVKRDWAMLRSRYGDLPGFADGGVVGPYARVGAGGSPSFAMLGTASDDLVHLLHNLNGLGERELKHRERLLDREERLAEKSLQQAKDRLDEERRQLQELRDQRRQFMQQVTGNFRSDVFGGNIDLEQAARQGLLGSDFNQALIEYLRANNIQMTAGTSLSDYAGQYLQTLSPAQIAALQAQASAGTLEQNAADAAAFEDVLKQLKAMGLTGGALHELEAQGNLAQAQAYLSMGPDFIRTLMADYRNRNEALRDLGKYVGNERFGADIRDQLKVARAQARDVAEAKAYLHALDQGQRAIKKEVAELKAATKHIGQDVAEANSGAVRHGQHRG